ncbi:hypothetical protein ACJD0Z_15195 [Flavobacteriaceae bacterium M23B6Z8]
MRKTLIVFLLVLLTSNIQAQQNDYDPFYLNENIPKSPEVSSLGEYGNYGVNPYNGKVNLAIPIHTISFEGLTIPITLSYNSSGVIVASEAGWTGLNWSLSANFAISRSVNGIDDLRNDDAPYGMGGKIGYIYNTRSVQVDTGGNPYYDYDDIVDVHLSFQPSDGNSLQLDTQPDIFEVSLFGTSYKFRLQKKGTSNILQTFVFNNNNVIITYDLVNHSFTIIDELGFRFDFATKDLSTTFSSTPIPSNGDNATSVDTASLYNLFSDLNRADESIVTSWHLDKITSPWGQELTFVYQRGLHLTFPSYTGYAQVKEEVVNYIPSANGIAVDSELYHSAVTIVENAHLQRISGDFGEVLFNTGSREDLMTGYSLNQLASFGTFVMVTDWSSVSNCHGTNSCNNSNDSPYTGHKLESIQVRDYLANTVVNATFNYSYFNSHKTNATDKKRWLRLKLDQITINEKNFKFTYEQPDGLPAKDTKDTDFWGYYNGAGNTQTIPSIGRFVTQAFNTSQGPEIGHTYFEYQGANRGSNFNYGKRGLLTRVDYPTGGYSEISYEAHQAVVPLTQPYVVTERFPHLNGRIKWTSLLDESKYNFSYEYLKRAKTPSYTLFGNEYIPNQNQVTIPIDKNQGFSVSSSALVQAEGNLQTQTGWNNISYYSSHPVRVVENIYDPTIQYVLYNYGQAPDQCCVTNYAQASAVLPPGDYRVAGRTAPFQQGNPGIPAVTVQEETDGDPNTTAYFLTMADPNSGQNLPDFTEQFEIGGARVSTITTRDNNNDFISRKRFDYNHPGLDPTVASSGVLMDELIFFSDAYGFHSYNPRGFADSQLKLNSNSTLRKNDAAQGSHIGYSYVREIFEDENNSPMGWISRNYFNAPNQQVREDHCRNYYSNPEWNGNEVVCSYKTIPLGLDPWISNAHSNGNVVIEKTFDCSGEELTRTSYQYTTLLGQQDPTFFASFMPLFQNRVGQYFEPNVDVYPNDHSSFYYPYKHPQHYGLQSVLWESTKTDLLTGIEVTTEMSNIYDASTHHLTEKEQIAESDRIYTTNLYYPYSTATYNDPFMSNLRTENRLGVVVKTEEYLNGSKLTTRLYNYDNSSSTANQTMVKSVSVAKASETPEERMRYEKFDTDGNLLQARKPDGSPVAYIWGYQNQYIIAKIENATYSQVSSYVANLQTLADADNSTCNQSGTCSEKNLRNALNDLRSQAALASTLITTYTYDPLVGVTSITNPNGVHSYFEYDSFNRLVAIRDKDHNLVEDYTYNLVDQILPNTTGSVKQEVFLCNTGESQPQANRSSQQLRLQSSAPRKASLSKTGPEAYKKLNAIIDLVRSFDASTNNTVVTYKAYPYGGSGKFKYRWRYRGGDFTPTSGQRQWVQNLTCRTPQERYLRVECEVVDTETGEIFLARLQHPLPCTQ